jgi:hypothetical protein
MSWLGSIQNIFSSSKSNKTEVELSHLLARWGSIKDSILALVEQQTPIFQKKWGLWAEHPLKLDDKEMRTALESCYSAIYFIRLIQEFEEQAWPGEWVGELLETIQKNMDEADEGCRIRYARGMLQEYAESGRRYRHEEKVLYFGEWLWNCNAKNNTLKGELNAIRALGKALLPEDEATYWLVKTQA